MMKHLTKIIGFVLLSAVVATSCKSESVKPMTPVEDNNPPPESELTVVKSANWNNRTDGAYSTAAAIADLGSLTGWKENRTYISNNTLRLKLEKDALSSAGGIVSRISLDEGTEYELQFRVKFHSEFDWSKGGKVGFGFRMGDGNTGCDRADDGNGGSARLMWYRSADGVVKFKPYLYYKDMPGTCGDNMVSSAVYPASGSIQKEKWYQVKIYVKSNSGSNADGRVKYTIDDVVVLDKPIRWTTNNAKRFINQLAFSTFRGGSTEEWESGTVGYIYFDDLVCTRIK